LGRKGEALTEFDLAANLWPDNPEYLLRVGDLLLELNDLNGAQPFYEAALALDPALHRTHFARYELFYRRREYGPALQSLDAALAGNPRKELFWLFKKAELLRRQGMPERVRPELSRYLDDPAIAFGHSLHCARAALHQELGNLAKAREEYEQAVAEDGGDVWAALGLGEVAEAKGDYERAFTAYASAGRLVPTSQDSFIASALLHYKLGQLPEAAAAARRAAELAPEDANTHFDFAQILRAMGDRPGAVREYESCLALDINNAEAWFFLSELYEQEGQLDAALRYVQEYLAVEPYERDGLNRARRLLEKLGRPDEARYYDVRDVEGGGGEDDTGL
ncbi:MAG: tetratricopeptide repeat protein, partial [Planctomycetes bacterium]|nr:tetratricopeptide repeat protein [Planctomycetota bacterium]